MEKLTDPPTTNTNRNTLLAAGVILAIALAAISIYIQVKDHDPSQPPAHLLQPREQAAPIFSPETRPKPNYPVPSWYDEPEPRDWTFDDTRLETCTGSYGAPSINCP